MAAQVFIAPMMERQIGAVAHHALMRVACEAGRRGHAYMAVPYTRIDIARNIASRRFCEETQADEDVLVMLDADHEHPEDVATRLSAHPRECGIVAALAFRRGPPYDPMAYLFTPEGTMLHLATWPEGLVEVDTLGTPAIAIRRWVFRELEEKGVRFPWFRAWYFEDPKLADTFPTEDIYFSAEATRAGIRCYVDTTLETPHLSDRRITHRDWEAWHAAHGGEQAIAPPPPRAARSFAGLRIPTGAAAITCLSTAGGVSPADSL